MALIAMLVGVATAQAAGNELVYGNEPNMAGGVAGGPAQQVPGTQAGNVLPTQSREPFVNNPTDPQNPTRGRSVGQFQQDGINIP